MRQVILAAAGAALVMATAALAQTPAPAATPGTPAPAMATNPPVRSPIDPAEISKPKPSVPTAATDQNTTGATQATKSAPK